MRLPQNLQSLTHETIKADSNGIDYDVWTWVPPGYEQSDEAYPLLFVLDGDMFMPSAIDTVALMSSIGEAREAILVGVTTAPPGNHGLQRTIDYSAAPPTAEIRATPEGAAFNFWAFYEQMAEAAGMAFEDLFGGTDEFHSFLADQLLPKLSASYRIDENEIGVAGHSSGGDFAVDTLLRQNTPFSKFIVGSFGTDVLEATLPERERAFRDRESPRQLSVFCGYGGAEHTDPFLKAYIERSVALMERLQESGRNVAITVRGFDKETHGSVFPHIFSTGYRELWGTGMSFVEAVAQAPESLEQSDLKIHQSG